MKNTLETRLGLFFAITVIAAFLLFEIVGGIEFFKGGYDLTAYFNNVHDLKIGDPVKMAGVQIGRVDKIGFANNRVAVDLKIEGKQVVKTDSRATIKFLGLMGQNYISVTLGTPAAEKMSAGGVLETDEQPDLNALMSRLENVAVGVENVTKSFSGDSIQNILGPITDFVKDNSETLSATLNNMKTVTDGIAKGEGTIGKLIKDDQLYYSSLGTVKKLEETAGSIQTTLEEAKTVFTSARGALNNASNTLSEVHGTFTEARQVVAGIREGKGSLGKMMTDEALYAETTASMSNLRQILEKINQGQGSVGKLVNDDSLFKNLKMTLQKVEKATEGLEDTGPLSVLGTAVSSLF